MRLSLTRGARTGTAPAAVVTSRGVVVAVADHQPVPVLVDLIGVGVDVGGDLGLQRRRQHLPGTVAHDLIEQRPARRAVLVGRIGVVNYLEHGRTFPNQRANAGLDQSYLDFRSSSGRCAPSRHLAEGHPQVLIIAPRKNRPGYEALAKAYEAGEFDALVCYDLDRLTRQPRQLEDWIEAAEHRGLALVTANGEADLTTDGGRVFARIKLAVARGEVDRKSRRQRDAASQRAKIGRPPLGVRLTGYTTKGEIVPSEADIVRRIFKMFHAGESLRSISRTLTDEGIVTRQGRPSNPSTIRGILVVCPPNNW